MEVNPTGVNRACSPSLRCPVASPPLDFPQHGGILRISAVMQRPAVEFMPSKLFSAAHQQAVSLWCHLSVPHLQLPSTRLKRQKTDFPSINIPPHSA